MAKLPPLPRKTLEQKINEEEINKLNREELKSVSKSQSITRRKRERLTSMSKDEKQKLHDFIFNGGTENPLEDIK